MKSIRAIACHIEEKFDPEKIILTEIRQMIHIHLPDQGTDVI